MRKILTAAEMREIDRLTTERYGIPSLLLMESAAHAASRIIGEKLGGSVAGKNVLILCGKGNNGGDGAALGRVLWTRGADVEVCMFGRVEDTTGDARTNFEILRKLSEQELTEISHADISLEEIVSLDDWKEYVAESYRCDAPEILVDALFGTGVDRALEDKYSEVADYVCAFNTEGFESDTLVVSLDMPSGLCADNCEPLGSNSNSHVTITFTAPKAANVLPPASNFNGELYIANIGTPPELIDASPSQCFLAEREDAVDWLKLTKFSSSSYKNKRGHALLVAGAKNFAGAAVLCGNAAIVSGAGLATVVTPESVHNAIASRMLPEVMTRSAAETAQGALAAEAAKEILDFIDGKIDAVAVGCGMTSSEDSTKQFVREFVENRKTPLLIDADGLNALAPFDLKGSDELPLILTPHEGEFLKLLGTKDKSAVKDRVSAVRDFAQKHHVILVLKGERTLIGAPDGRVVINPTGNSGLGKAGNGDTLAGIIAGFIAQAVPMKVDIYQTVVAAIYIGALAGDIAARKFGRRSMLATDVKDCLEEAFIELRAA
jgi:ADP-dependent NAD(P)H-hydrate dehydratase / NAD(P)H-hydrate epimerase